MKLHDDAPALLREGYAFLPRQRRERDQDAVRLQLLGKRVVAGCGPGFTRQFYDESYVERGPAMPGLVKHTLIGSGAVHTLDQAEHRQRKKFFLSVLNPSAITALAQQAGRVWDAAAERWADRDEVVLFDEAARVLLEAVWDWAGLPRDVARDPGRTTQDMVAMVDAFGSVGPRNLRGRVARGRQEHRLARLVGDVRAGRRAASPGTLLAEASALTDEDGARVPPRVAAVEILNVVRPTVAAAWFLAYAGLALEEHPRYRAPLAAQETSLVRGFAHEVRRFYPFAPFVGGQARRTSDWGPVTAEPGDLVVLDIYGQLHHPDLWGDPDTFRPERFDGVRVDPFTLVPQGGGSPATGHRCPGEPAVVLLLEVLLPRLARLAYDVPPQDLSVDLSRVPARPRSGLRVRVRRSGE